MNVNIIEFDIFQALYLVITPEILPFARDVYQLSLKESQVSWCLEFGKKKLLYPTLKDETTSWDDLENYIICKDIVRKIKVCILNINLEVFRTYEMFSHIADDEWLFDY